MRKVHMTLFSLFLLLTYILAPPFHVTLSVWRNPPTYWHHHFMWHCLFEGTHLHTGTTISCDTVCLKEPTYILAPPFHVTLSVWRNPPTYWHHHFMWHCLFEGTHLHTGTTISCDTVCLKEPTYILAPPFHVTLSVWRNPPTYWHHHFMWHCLFEGTHLHTGTTISCDTVCLKEPSSLSSFMTAFLAS